MQGSNNNKGQSHVQTTYLFFPWEWEDTIKFIGGSKMAADSNFQACLWFDHSSYSKLPVWHRLRDENKQIRTQKRVMSKICVWKNYCEHLKRLKGILLIWMYSSLPKFPKASMIRTVSIKRMLSSDFSSNIYLQHCKYSNVLANQTCSMWVNNIQIKTKIQKLLASCMYNLNSFFTQSSTANTWTSCSSYQERNMIRIFHNPIPGGWAEIR